MEELYLLIPANSDLREAITMATQLRNDELEGFIEKIKNGALEEDKTVLQAKFDKLLKMNENIKLLKDAAILVYSKKSK